MMIADKRMVEIVYETAWTPDPRPAISDSGQSEELVGLQAQPPPRMAKAILDGAADILGLIRAVHRLEQEVCEVEVLEPRERV